MRDYFTASLHAAPTYRIGEPITITFELTNTAEQDVRILEWDTPLEGEVLAYFEVRHEGEIVPYDGRFLKRGDPEESSYRLVRAGETVADTIDLTTAYPIAQPGQYTVTLAAHVLDAIPQGEEVVTKRTRSRQEGFELDRLSVTFEVVGDGEARPTVAEKIRRDLRHEESHRVADTSPKLSPREPVINGGDDAARRQTRTAHENAGVFAETVMRQLDWTPGAANALYQEWMGAFDTGRHAIVRQHFADSCSVVTGQTVTYDLSGTGCTPGTFAYTYKNTRKIWLCSQFWPAPATGVDSKFGTMVHELSHAVSSTDDVVYGQVNARALAASNPADAIRNADNHEYFAETLAERVVTAPVVWNNGKAYFFVAGNYYRYDIAIDKVDPGYPLPIEGNWGGLFPDRVDAGVMWPNGKAYFFRGSEYVRYDVAADQADPGYPLPINPNWPGLWADGIDAGVVWPNGKAYFFRGSEYVRYDVAADQADPGYPLPINPNWPGLWPADLTGGVVWNDTKAYFFRGAEYVRYDISADQVDPGYPLPVDPYWPGLP
ncbi:hemopexin repeat-containing protein [Actinomadura sp. 3N508]|uniref:hemopexin repeat-containing protein n=1 Tax=Actinomadura sp. 3N508 TaxID=3375153 RepID=UPI0037B6A36F